MTKKATVLPTTENVPLVEKYILEKFKDNTFKKSTPFPSISTKPTHIHLKTGYTQYAQHAPISIALHWKEEVKQSLNEDLVIEPVSIGEPVKWWSKMIVITRNDGRSRRTISLQQPNAQCQRETHHCQSPFKVVCQVPPNMKKTIFDAVDGYHAIPLDEASKSLAKFIMEWKRYRCN